MELSLYEFVYRGQLADQALDATGRAPYAARDLKREDVADALSLELFDKELLESALAMSIVYAAIAAFEHSARKFISRVLLDEFAEEWWEKGVSQKIRTFAEDRRDEELKTKWHGFRGADLLSYTELKHLSSIIQQNVTLFEPYIRTLDWVKSIFDPIERSRNVIMHSGHLDMADIERVGILMRDWNKQVGL
ncbi:Swt1 family HEPN domain-containing protein [Salinibacterium sp. ZJ77]|uniref:Swt1 family HEPN domain-containing protein n=1 Tax=Salinibacterium sp. ZJ77 TaxID=2708337 RepID=UPI001AB04B4C|nr:Swt1 family HEPN domain-containing protein [Salinibacterium sp. ZJ77]